MQRNSSQYPEVRVQQSTPNHGFPSATPPPLVTDDSDIPLNGWNYQDASYLSPHTQQQYLPTSYRSHKRLSSESSIGSAGPDSPYTQLSTFPQIVDSDNQSVHSAHFDPLDGSFSAPSQYTKSAFAASTQNGDQPLYPAFQNFNLASNNGVPMMPTQTDATSNPGNSVRRNMIGLKNSSRGSNGSYNGEGDSTVDFRTNAPKFDRTMSDIFQDELYNPAMAQTAPSSQPRQTMMQSNQLSPQRTAFNDLLQAANKDHISSQANAHTVNSMASRRSPFRPQPNPSISAARLNSAAQENQNPYAQHPMSRHDFTSPPKTISPKEAELHCRESEDYAKMPLFPSGKSDPELQQSNATINEPSFGSVTSNRRQSSSNYSASPAPSSQNTNFKFMPPSIPGMPQQMPQQYPFIQRQSSSMRSSNSDQFPEFPAHLSSMESTKSESGQTEGLRVKPHQETPPSSQEGPVQRPADTSANSGSYTCTEPNCHARFDSNPKLHKHRREAHRISPTYTSTPTTPSSASASTSYNQQAAANNISRNNQPGPHKCEKLNPSTGKPCNTIFSRSYDLTRHEETIHNSRKQKVRCHLCTEEKTFSRNDALTRHMRVVHPDVDFPGKTRRSKGNTGVDVVRQRIEDARGGR